MSEAKIRAAFAGRIGQRIAIADDERVYDQAGNDVGRVRDHGFRFSPHQVGPDEVVLGKWVDDQGVLNLHGVPAAKLTEFFGALFAIGKPTVLQFTAACDAPPGCRGYHRYALKFKNEGILA